MRWGIGFEKAWSSPIGRTNVRSSRLDGGEAACASGVRIKRTVAESGLLRGIKSDPLTPEIIADIGRETRQSLRAATRLEPAPDPKRVASVEEEIRDLVDAIANGALRASPKVAAHPVKTADIERLVGLVLSFRWFFDAEDFASFGQCLDSLFRRATAGNRSLHAGTDLQRVM
jgi:hypothetical protein